MVSRQILHFGRLERVFFLTIVDGRSSDEETTGEKAMDDDRLDNGASPWLRSIMLGQSKSKAVEVWRIRSP